MKSLVDALQKESFGDSKTKKKEENYKLGIGKGKGKPSKKKNTKKDKSLEPPSSFGGKRSLKLIGAA
jgi:hypothetical protein